MSFLSNCKFTRRLTTNSLFKVQKQNFFKSSICRLRIGDEAPNFSASTTQGNLDFHSFLGDSWGILFSHPADFTALIHRLKMFQLI